MKLKLTITLFMIGLLFLGTSSAMINFERQSPISTNNVTITSVTDLPSTSYYLLEDNPNDARNSERELHGMHIGINTSHVIIAVQGNTTNSGTHLLIDLDPGQGTGFKGGNAMWWRNFNLTNGLGAEFIAAGWQQNFADLWNGTADTPGGIAPLGYNFTIDGPNEIKYYYFAHSLLFPTPPTDGGVEFGVIALTVGGDNTNADDVIPSQAGIPKNDVDTTFISQALIIKGNITSGTLDQSPEVGWMGTYSDNLSGGNLTAGNALELAFEAWLKVGTDSTVLYNHANTSTLIDVTITVERDESNSTTQHKAYREFGTLLGGFGSNAKYVMNAPATLFQEGDKVYWEAEANRKADGVESFSGIFYVNPLPPMYVNFLGGITPTGGFITPESEYTIRAQNNLRFVDNNETFGINTDPAANVPVNTTLYIVYNNTQSLNASYLMDWVSFVNNNNNYELKLSAPIAGNATFWITTMIDDSNQANATLAIVISASFTILFGIEPPRILLYSINDPADDLSLILPTGPPPPDSDWGSPGLMDLFKFEILANDYNVEFKFYLVNVTNPFGAPGGWSSALVSMYIDIAPGGSTATVKQERVMTASGWEFALAAQGFNTEFFTHTTYTSGPLGGSGFVATGNTTGNYISYVVPVTTLGGPPTNDWAYYVMVGSDDYNNYRAAGPTAGDWQLGGGVAGDTDPNVIDMFVPAGSPEGLQDLLLSKYNLETGQLATVLPVGPNQVFVEDNISPEITLLVEKSDGTTIVNGSTINITTDDIVLSLDISATDELTNPISAIDRIEIFSGPLLITTFSSINANEFKTVYNLTLTQGTYNLRVNVFDAFENFESIVFIVTIVGPEKSTTTTPTTPTDDTSEETSPGFLSFNPIYLLFGIVAATFLVIFKRKK
jgi:hypothetical protein